MAQAEQLPRLPIRLDGFAAVFAAVGVVAFVVWVAATTGTTISPGGGRVAAVPLLIPFGAAICGELLAVLQVLRKPTALGVLALLVCIIVGLFSWYGLVIVAFGPGAP